MTTTTLLRKAKSLFPGRDLYVQDRRTWKDVPGNPLSRKVLLSEVGPLGFGHCIAFGDDPSEVLEKAQKRAAEAP